MQVEQRLLISAPRLVMLYISTKLCELSRTVSKLYTGHDFYTENYKGE